jgi:hypothetical protein
MAGTGEKEHKLSGKTLDTRKDSLRAHWLEVKRKITEYANKECEEAPVYKNQVTDNRIDTQPVSPDKPVSPRDSLSGFPDTITDSKRYSSDEADLIWEAYSDTI